MAIDVVRRNEGPKEFSNGYGQEEWLPGMNQLVKSYKCILKEGFTHTPELFEDKTVVYMFSHGSGYIMGKNKAYNIDEISFYVPDFNNQTYSIYAATDLEFMKVVVDMSENDKQAYLKTHTLLPMFQTLSEAPKYTQTCKGPNTESWSIIHRGTLGRVLMGVVRGVGEGTIEKGHPTVDQWNYTLPGSDFTFTIENESIHHAEGEWSFVKAGLDHSLVSEPGKTAYYVWFEIMTQEKLI